MAATRHHLARPPYVDPNTNIIFDTDNAEYEGWLTKQSMWLKVSFASFNRCVPLYGFLAAFVRMRL